jgi:hypothetical protein
MAALEDDETFRELQFLFILSSQQRNIEFFRRHILNSTLCIHPIPLIEPAASG